MSIFGELKQKVKGKSQRSRGEFDSRRGKGIKGGMSKIKGRMNEAVSDTKSKIRKERKKGKI